MLQANAAFGKFSKARNRLRNPGRSNLLLAIAFFALYTAITGIEPNAFLASGGPTHHPADLLYFSLVTLTTLGYGDIVPVGREVRRLAGLEAATGVLYVAITVALLVSAYTARPGDGGRS